MGQYHLVVNLDRKEYIQPHNLDVGYKQGEQLHSTPSTPHALFILLCNGERRGGGDLNDRSKPLATSGPRQVYGRWAGERIAVVGDYAKDGDFSAPERISEIFNECITGLNGWKDISYLLRPALEAEFGGKFKRTVGTVGPEKYVRFTWEERA